MNYFIDIFCIIIAIVAVCYGLYWKRECVFDKKQLDKAQDRAEAFRQTIIRRDETIDKYEAVINNQVNGFNDFRRELKEYYEEREAKNIEIYEDAIDSLKRELERTSKEREKDLNDLNEYWEAREQALKILDDDTGELIPTLDIIANLFKIYMKLEDEPECEK